MDIHKLGHISVSVCHVLVLESISQCSTLFGDDGSLFSSCFGLPYSSDQFPAGRNELAAD